MVQPPWNKGDGTPLYCAAPSTTIASARSASAAPSWWAARHTMNAELPTRTTAMAPRTNRTVQTGCRRNQAIPVLGGGEASPARRAGQSEHRIVTCP
jgi:hypothetical protein